MKVWPIGYEQDPSGTRITSLMKEDPAMQLIDCRLNPWSWRIQWQKDALVKQWGERYHLAGQWLGNRKHPSNQLHPGKVEIELVDPKRGIQGLQYYLTREQDLILLCQCLEYRYCHLQAIVDLLKVTMPEVEVILPESKPYEPEFKYPAGAKVFLKKSKEEVAAIVLKSAFAPQGNYDWVWLRAAQYDQISQKLLINDLSKPIQSYRLKKRGTTVPGLDE